MKILFLTKIVQIFFTVLIVATVVNAEEGIKGEFLLEVSFNQRQLVLYEIKGNGAEELRRYQVAVPTSNWYPLPLKGRIVKIEKNPWWYPTLETRAHYKERGIILPPAVRPGDPQNAMGKVKFRIVFENGFDQPIMLHGTNDPSSIGKRATRGCIRMYNKDGLELAEIIGTTREAEIIFNH